MTDTKLKEAFSKIKEEGDKRDKRLNDIDHKQKVISKDIKEIKQLILNNKPKQIEQKKDSKQKGYKAKIIITTLKSRDFIKDAILLELGEDKKLIPLELYEELKSKYGYFCRKTLFDSLRELRQEKEKRIGWQKNGSNVFYWNEKAKKELIKIKERIERIRLKQNANTI